MKRIYLSTLGVLALALLVSAYSRTTQSPASKTADVTAQTLTIQSTQSAKAKKVLVKELPKTIEGLVLENGVFKLKSGYKFVPQPNNTVAVALQTGGRGVTGSFDCFCAKEGGGNCSATTVGGTISCHKSKTTPCSDECILRTTINGLKTKLAIF
jgi:hypothetical protein